MRNIQKTQILVNNVVNLYHLKKSIISFVLMFVLLFIVIIKERLISLYVYAAVKDFLRNQRIKNIVHKNVKFFMLVFKNSSKIKNLIYH